MSEVQDDNGGASHPRRRRLVNHGHGHTPHGNVTIEDHRKLVLRLNEMEREMEQLGIAISPTAKASPTTGAVNKDARWHCSKCGYLLGFYDIKSDVMRTRYKEHIVFVRCGPGGFIQVVCRGCSEVNTQEFAESAEGGE